MGGGEKILVQTGSETDKLLPRSERKKEGGDSPGSHIEELENPHVSSMGGRGVGFGGKERR